MAKPLKRGLAPTHPGERLHNITLPALLTDQGLSLGDFAERLGVARPILAKLVAGQSSMTPSMALRLARVLDTSPELWMDMQAAYDLWKAEAAMADQLAALKPLPKVGARR
jgi:addiction module HigA family antidote